MRDEMRQHYATKADLANPETRLTRWFVSIMLGILVIGISVVGLIVTVILTLI